MLQIVAVVRFRPLQPSLHIQIFLESSLFTVKNFISKREPVVTIVTHGVTASNNYYVIMVTGHDANERNTDTPRRVPRPLPSSSSGRSSVEPPPRHNTRSSSDRGRNLRRRAHPLPDSPTFPGSPPIVLPPSPDHMARHVAGKRARVTFPSRIAVSVGGVRYGRPVYDSRRGPYTCDAASSIEQEAQAVEIVTGKLRRKQQCSTFTGKSSLSLLIMLFFE